MKPVERPEIWSPANPSLSEEQLNVEDKVIQVRTPSMSPHGYDGLLIFPVLMLNIAGYDIIEEGTHGFAGKFNGS